MKFSLNYSENVQAVEKEKKFFFLQYLIEQVAELSPNEDFDYIINLNYENLETQDKMKIQDIFSKYKIQVIDDEDMKIYMDNDLIGLWYKPTYKLKKNHEEIDYRKQLYQEMSCSFESVFDKEESI